MSNYIKISHIQYDLTSFLQVVKYNSSHKPKILDSPNTNRKIQSHQKREYSKNKSKSPNYLIFKNLLKELRGRLARKDE